MVIINRQFIKLINLFLINLIFLKIHKVYTNYLNKKFIKNLKFFEFNLILKSPS